jgi:hypothetical protein
MLHSQKTVSSEAYQEASEGQPIEKIGVERSGRTGYKIWIDLENSPHVPFFLPIIREMEARGCTVVLTARDCFQVCELADLAGLKYSKIGRHYGKNPFAKLFGLGVRILRLAPRVLRERPKISVSHNSRSSIILSGLLGIPSLNIIDYEFADQRITGLFGSRQKKWVLTPAVVPTENFEKSGSLRDHILHYPGIKEDVYVPFFQPDQAWLKSLAIKPEDVVVTIRPPATEAHYHNPESEKLLMVVFDRLEEHPGVKTILLPRTPRQEAEIRQARPELFASGRIIVPKHALNGLDLIWRSDLVISGGGTMNREAAALGVPVYSLFRGALGAVDKHLAETGKLILLESDDDVRDKLRIARRARPAACTPSKGSTLDVVVNHVFAVARSRG